jgi:hypothetical protein
MSEAELLANVLLLADYLHLLAYHDNDPRRNLAGFPDLVIAGPRGVIFAELKSGTGGYSAAQKRWRWMLQASGATYRLWRPGDLTSGKIEDQLRGIA